MKKMLKTMSLCLALAFFSLAPISACGKRETEPEDLSIPAHPAETPDNPQEETIEEEPQTPETEVKPQTSEEKSQTPETTKPQTSEEKPQTPETGTKPQTSEEKPQKPATETKPQTPKEEPQTPAAAKTARYLRVLTNGLNLRTGAGTGYASLGQAQKGELLALSGRTGNWYETRYRGRTAYVSADARYTEMTELPAADKRTEAVIEEGLKLLGTPYVYGAVRFHDGRGNRLTGFTDSKFDCSSLMQYIFYKGAGIELDVTTRTQIKQGKKVGEAELSRGDLLFFTNDSRRDNTGLERVGHVALYLGGNYILHTASDYAKIEQISAKRKGYFLEARSMF